jgi:hypothetical protein
VTAADSQYSTDVNLRARQRLWPRQFPPVDLLGSVIDLTGATAASQPQRHDSRTAPTVEKSASPVQTQLTDQNGFEFQQVRRTSRSVVSGAPKVDRRFVRRRV